jgi:hypothetical protein
MFDATNWDKTVHTTRGELTPFPWGWYDCKIGFETKKAWAKKDGKNLMKNGKKYYEPGKNNLVISSMTILDVSSGKQAQKDNSDFKLMLEGQALCVGIPKWGEYQFTYYADEYDALDDPIVTFDKSFLAIENAKLQLIFVPLVMRAMEAWAIHKKIAIFEKDKDGKDVLKPNMGFSYLIKLMQENEAEDFNQTKVTVENLVEALRLSNVMFKEDFEPKVQLMIKLNKLEPFFGVDNSTADELELPDFDEDIPF